jgi:DNA-binding MarR family transcriptional regulator
MSSDVSVGYLVKQLQQAFRARMDAALEEIALTTSQYALLNAIEEAPGSSGAELARRCFITPQSVNGLMAELQRKALIERSASATHGRIIETRLSEDGRAQLSLARERVFPIEGRMLKKLDRSQRQELAMFLKICIDSIDR